MDREAKARRGGWVFLAAVLVLAGFTAFEFVRLSAPEPVAKASSTPTVAPSPSPEPSPDPGPSRLALAKRSDRLATALWKEEAKWVRKGDLNRASMVERAFSEVTGCAATHEVFEKAEFSRSVQSVYALDNMGYQKHIAPVPAPPGYYSLDLSKPWRKAVIPSTEWLLLVGVQCVTL